MAGFLQIYPGACRRQAAQVLYFGKNDLGKPVIIKIIQNLLSDQILRPFDS